MNAMRRHRRRWRRARAPRPTPKIARPRSAASARRRAIGARVPALVAASGRRRSRRSMVAASIRPRSGIRTHAERGRRRRARACARRRSAPTSVGSGCSQPQRSPRAVQVEAVQAEAAADEREPGRDASWSEPARRAVMRAASTGGAPCRPARGAFASCTTSSQRSNFQPAALERADLLEAERAVHADRAGIGESPITASICRAPAASQRASSSASSSRPKPRPTASGAR